ncbi:MAG: hypothetical protein AUJ21_00575 [Anaerolineae bacterium CG1_02_58_13]|nr:MAG: hypothetical protein AUJ21_00575 [Anaerolineae bacterium CG1_02_58_13]
MRKIVTKIKMSGQKNDAEYWRAQPPSARLAALEEIVREYHGWKVGEEPRMQKVFRIIKMVKNASGRINTPRE